MGQNWLATGQAVTRVQELVDPARCRIWAGHNRDYGALDEAGCADLLDSLRAQGRQEVPAIVRRVVGDADADYEVICGARRHWSVSWLRGHDRPEFRFLVEKRELSDEEAFRVADLENRSRKDLSDYERARDYARAVERYYDGSQQRMAERLQVSKSWLSRYLELAKLPDEVMAAFGSPHEIGISHAAKLAPLLRAPFTRTLVEAAALAVAGEQAVRRSAGEATLPPQMVVGRLTEAQRRVRPMRRAMEMAEGKRVFAQCDAHGTVTIVVPVSARGEDEALLAAIGRLLGRFA